MKPELFAELLTAANLALEHAQGKRSLRTATLPQLPEPMTAEEVREVREALQASQGVFARYLNVSTKLVQAWESSERTPSGPALVLLRIMEKQPGLVDTFFAHKSVNGRTARKNGKKRKTA